MEKDGDVLEVVQCDNANEFKFGKFAAYCLHNNVHQRFSLPYCQWQNGVAERANRTLVEMANCLLWNTRLSGGYWLLAMQQAAYIINRCISVDKVSPYQKWFGHPPDVSNIFIFGSH